MQILIKGARVLDPGNIDEKKDLLIQDKVIAAILDPSDTLSGTDLSQVQVVDATGMIVVPGLIDMHVHLREPGHEYKETIESGLKARQASVLTIILFSNCGTISRFIDWLDEFYK